MSLDALGAELLGGSPTSKARVPVEQAFGGYSGGAASTSGSLNYSASLASAAAGRSTTTATVRPVRQLVGSPTGKATGRGSLSYQKLLVGRSNSASTVVTSMARATAFAGRVTGTSATSNTGKVVRPLNGRAAGISTAVGTFTMVRGLTGLSHGASGTLGPHYTIGPNGVTVTGTDNGDGTWTIGVQWPNVAPFNQVGTNDSVDYYIVRTTGGADATSMGASVSTHLYTASPYTATVTPGTGNTFSRVRVTDNGSVITEWRPDGATGGTVGTATMDYRAQGASTGRAVVRAELGHLYSLQGNVAGRGVITGDCAPRVFLRNAVSAGRGSVAADMLAVSYLAGSSAGTSTFTPRYDTIFRGLRGPVAGTAATLAEINGLPRGTATLLTTATSILTATNLWHPDPSATTHPLGVPVTLILTGTGLSSGSGYTHNPPAHGLPAGTNPTAGTDCLAAANYTHLAPDNEPLGRATWITSSIPWSPPDAFGELVAQTEGKTRVTGRMAIAGNDLHAGTISGVTDVVSRLKVPHPITAPVTIAGATRVVTGIRVARLHALVQGSTLVQTTLTNRTELDILVYVGIRTSGRTLTLSGRVAKSNNESQPPNTASNPSGGLAPSRALSTYYV